MAYSLDPTYLERLRVTMPLLQTVGGLEYARGQQDLFRTQAPELLRELQTIATIESTESSNRLEGIAAPRQQIENLVLKDLTPRTRSEAEIAGYRDALRMIHEDSPYMRFSENTLKQIHGMLYRYVSQPGGSYKATQNDIVEKDARGEILRVRFRPLSPVQTPGAMLDLIEDYTRATATYAAHPLILTALTVFDFLSIHPFSDGNGRTARLLTLLLLYQHGYDVGRYISLERVIEESRDTYYEALEASSQGWHEGQHDPVPWLEYFLGFLTRAYGEFEGRVSAARGARGTKGEMVRQAAMRRVSPFKISDIERELPNVSREMIRNVLGQLRNEGVLRLSGTGRGSRYVPVRTDTDGA